MAVERGDLRSTSWRMRVAREKWVGDVRHVQKIAELRDITVIAGPAYAAAAAERHRVTRPGEWSRGHDGRLGRHELYTFALAWRLDDNPKATRHWVTELTPRSPSDDMPLMCKMSEGPISSRSPLTTTL